MNDEPSQLPWHLEGKCIYTAHGDFIGEMEHTDDARLVEDAVNERDRLRDIVRKMARVAQDALDLAKALCDTFGDNPEREKARSEIEALLREARAAIGEDAPSAPCAPAPSVVSFSTNHEKP